ncbi:MAG: amidohydrolase family protein [Syntrophomonadaceae bacterium]
MPLWLAVVGLLAAPVAPPRALVGATLVDGTGAVPVAHATVVVRDGRIECAGRDCRVPAGAAATDVSGTWILPGLNDAHVHLAQTGWVDGRPDAVDLRATYPYENVEADLAAHPERFFRADLCSGVTAIFDVGGYPWSLDLARREKDDPAAPRLTAAGPLLSTIDFWLNLPAERQFIDIKDSDTARAGVRYLAARGASAAKVWYIVTPQVSVEASAPAVMAAGEEAARLGLPLIVHATGLAEAKQALRAGARLLVHSVDDELVDDEFLTLAKSKGTIYCPTLTVMRGYVRLQHWAATGEAPSIDDPNGCVDAATRAKIASAPPPPSPDQAARAQRLEATQAEASRVIAANLKRVAGAGIPVAMGTDAGNPLTLHGPSVYAEMEAMQAAGLAPMQVIVAATHGASLAMGAQNVTGTIERGRSADLIVVEADPTADVANLRRLRSVMRAGVLYPQEQLRAPGR